MGLNFFKIALKFQGYPIDFALDNLNYLKHLSNEDFQSYVEKIKWNQFNYHFKNNKFYRSFIANKSISKWTDIPIITKQDIQRPLSDLLASEFTEKKLFKNSTSGSSGTPFTFAKDKLAHAKTWALNIDRYSMHGIEYGVSMQARFYGIPLVGIKYYKEKLKDLSSSRVRFPVFNLSDNILWQFINKFKKQPFEYINGYTSCLVYFAEFCIVNKIVLRDFCPTLKVCFPTSEMCSNDDKKILEKGFGIKVAVEYGCAEIDVIAFEDQDGDMIVSNENIILEILDDEGNQVQDGKEGRIVLTSLNNKAIPFYRYDIGDIGIVRPERKGKYQVLERIIGRTNEFALLPSGRKVPALTFYYITKSLIRENFKIKEFVIRQTALDTFKFEYVSEVELDSSLKDLITNSMEIYLESGLLANFEKKDFIERSTSGKLKQFFREF